MLQKFPPPVETLRSKDRAFGEYAKKRDHLCSCYQYDGDGPPQYGADDIYFCFAKFPNPFASKWVYRYAAMSILVPVLDVLHDVERKLGRQLVPAEWARVEGILLQGNRPTTTSAKGMKALTERAELWLKANMIDEIDHRMVNSLGLGADWKARNATLCRLYGGLEWARLGTDGKDWMRLHAVTGTLEMLRQTDHLYMTIPLAYVEPPNEEKDTAVNTEKDKASRAAAEALTVLEAFDTTAETTQGDLLPPDDNPPEDNRYGD